MSDVEPSVFTKIINGDIPCHKVYEDDVAYAIMDIHPVQQGMVVVFTKKQVDNYEDLEDDDFVDLMRVAKKISQAQRKVYPDKKKIGLQIEGLEAPHVHVKLFPVNRGSEYRAKPPTEDPDHDALEKQAEKIRQALES